MFWQLMLLSDSQHAEFNSGYYTIFEDQSDLMRNWTRIKCLIFLNTQVVQKITYKVKNYPLEVDTHSKFNWIC